MSIEEQPEQSSLLPPASAGRIRSHSLKPQHSRIDYARRKSTADLPSTIVSCWNSSGENNQSEISPKTPSPSWFERRFTLFSLDQPIDDRRRMTTDCLPLSDERAYADLLKNKRPSLIAQMMEVEARRPVTFPFDIEQIRRSISLFSPSFDEFPPGRRNEIANASANEKKVRARRIPSTYSTSPLPDHPVIDPVYETLKVAAETRKRALAIYLQQRQQSLNKQTSLNSQGSSELDIHPSPAVARHHDSNSSSSQAQASPLASGKRTSLVHFSSVVETCQLTMKRSE